MKGRRRLAIACVGLLVALFAASSSAHAVDCCICNRCPELRACFAIEDSANCDVFCHAYGCAGGDFNPSTDCFAEMECEVIDPAIQIIPPVHATPLFGPFAAGVAALAALAGAGLGYRRRSRSA